jgi:hypothetical protein
VAPKEIQDEISLTVALSREGLTPEKRGSRNRALEEVNWSASWTTLAGAFCVALIFATVTTVRHLSDRTDPVIAARCAIGQQRKTKRPREGGLCIRYVG